MVGPVPASWAVAPADAGAQELRPGLWRLRLPTAWQGIERVNAYAVEREDGVLLVDCGSTGDESCWDALVAALAQAGFAVGDVRALAATHAHSDHIGPAARLVAESGCEFWMHPDHGHMTDVIRRPHAFEEARERRARQEGVPEGLLHLYRDVAEEVEGVLAPVEPNRALVAGVELDSRLGPWRVIETPGHAPSHVCLYQPSRRVLVAGDLLSTVFAPYFDYGVSPDPVAEFLASLAAVEGLEVELALPGHGRPVEDLREVVAEHRAGVEARLAATEEAVRAGPSGGYEITGRVFGEPPSEMVRVWQLVEVVSYLRHLRLAGRIVRDEAPDGTFRYCCAAIELQEGGG